MFQDGEIVTSDGKKITDHAGVAGYTVGQRKGIGVTLPGAKPLFVLKLEPKKNRVVVGYEEELLATEVRLEDLVWNLGDQNSARVMAKIRYNMDPAPAMLYGGDEPKIVFDDPVRAVTPGQIAVAYRGQTVAAGGRIL